MLIFVLLLGAALLALGPRPGAWVRRAGWRVPAEEEDDRSSSPRTAVLARLGILLMSRIRGGGRRTAASDLESMAVLVQHLSALLSGGRGPAQAWHELLEFQRSEASNPSSDQSDVSRTLDLGFLAAAAQAAALGESPALAIHRRVEVCRSGGTSLAVTRQWARLAACVHASEISGCPLAELLTRFALDLEHSADAERSRQTALAGPRASVALLGWLPFLGLGLGLLLGVDPVDIVLRSPIGGLSVVAGLLFWVVGRVWSARLVHHAEAGAG